MCTWPRLLQAGEPGSIANRQVGALQRIADHAFGLCRIALEGQLRAGDAHPHRELVAPTFG